MAFVNSRIVYSLLFYILIIILVVVSKPSFMFKKDGTPIEYGVGEGRTVLSFGVFIVVAAIASFYIFSILDVIF